MERIERRLDLTDTFPGVDLQVLLGWLAAQQALVGQHRGPLPAYVRSDGSPQSAEIRLEAARWGVALLSMDARGKASAEGDGG